MAVLGGGTIREPSMSTYLACHLEKNGGMEPSGAEVQGYLAHKKQPPPP